MGNFGAFETLISAPSHTTRLIMELGLHCLKPHREDNQRSQISLSSCTENGYAIDCRTDTFGGPKTSTERAYPANDNTSILLEEMRARLATNAKTLQPSSTLDHEGK